MRPAPHKKGHAQEGQKRDRPVQLPRLRLDAHLLPRATDEDADEFGTDGVDGVAAVSRIYIVADDRVQKDDEAGKDHQEPDDQ